MSGGQELDEVDRDAKLTRLVQADIVTRYGSGSPLDIIGQPVDKDAGLLDAVLEERAEERREGNR